MDADRGNTDIYNPLPVFSTLGMPYKHSYLSHMYFLTPEQLLSHQKFPSILWNPKNHYHVPILGKIYQVHILHPILILQLRFSCQNSVRTPFFSPLPLSLYPLIISSFLVSSF
jgi:hypothetical protein